MCRSGAADRSDAAQASRCVVNSTVAGTVKTNVSVVVPFRGTLDLRHLPCLPCCLDYGRFAALSQKVAAWGNARLSQNFSQRKAGRYGGSAIACKLQLRRIWSANRLPACIDLSADAGAPCSQRCFSVQPPMDWFMQPQRVLPCLSSVPRSNLRRLQRQQCSLRAAPVRSAAADHSYATDAIAAAVNRDSVPARRYQDWTVYKGKSALCVKVLS